MGSAKQSMIDAWETGPRLRCERCGECMHIDDMAEDGLPIDELRYREILRDPTWIAVLCSWCNDMWERIAAE